MEPKRLGGALLTAVATGVGIMVPYTFKTMTPVLMAVIWSALVFAAVCGLVLALKPDSSHPDGAGMPPTAPAPKQPRRSALDGLDPQTREVVNFYLTLGVMIGGPVILFLCFAGLFRLAGLLLYPVP